MVAASARAGIPLQAASSGTMFGFYFLKEKGNDIYDYATAKEHADTERYGRFFKAMLDRGFYFAPSQFEAGFMSSAHTQQDVEDTISTAAEVLARI
jgi:glutamate-1-semialdehyde 2,1-aminomutase